jgi:hypothetical protein
MLVRPSVFRVSVPRCFLACLPGSDQSPSELIQAGEETSLSAIHKYINSIWNKEELTEWKESIIQCIHKVHSWIWKIVARKQIELATCGLRQNVGVTIYGKLEVWIL